MKIACFASDSESANSFYRTIMPFAEMRHIIEEFWLLDEVSWSKIAFADVLFMERPITQSHIELMRYAQQLGKPVWIDYDDLLTELPPHNSTYGFYQSKQPYYLQALDACTVCTVTTSAIKDSMIPRHAAKCVVIPNALPVKLLNFYEPDRALDRANVLAWRGSPTHDKDILINTHHLVKMIGTREFHVFGNFTAALAYVCMDPHLSKQGKIIVHPPAPMLEYLNKFAFTRPQALWVPLEDNKFNTAKSNIAWLEATMVGAKTYATKIGEFAKHGYIGSIDGKQPADEKMSLEAVMDQYTLDRVNVERTFLLKNI